MWIWLKPPICQSLWKNVRIEIDRDTIHVKSDAHHGAEHPDIHLHGPLGAAHRTGCSGVSKLRRRFSHGVTYEVLAPKEARK